MPRAHPLTSPSRIVAIRRASFDVLMTVGHRTTRARLILVEDDQDNLEGLSMLLAEKYDVFGYASPTEALKAVGAIKPDLLLLDIGTAPMDGVECLERIRAIPGYLEVPAVAFTGYGRDVERERFLAAGFDAVVVKPVIHPRELIAVIERVLASRAETDERATTHQHRSAPRVVARLDVTKTTTASSVRGFRETEGPASRQVSDENAG